MQQLGLKKVKRHPLDRVRGVFVRVCDVFGRGVAPNVTSVPPPLSASRPGTVGLGADGHIRIEPLAGRTVLAAGRDLVLELHRIAMRLNSTEKVMAACACLAPPATCRPVIAEFKACLFRT